MVTNQKIFVQIIQGMSSQSQGVMSPSCDDWLHKVWRSLQGKNGVILESTLE